MNDYYILIDKIPIRYNIEKDGIGRWAEDVARPLFRNKIGNIRISTIFLGIDHYFKEENHEPILFETIIFGGKHDQYQKRSSTWEEAKQIHIHAVCKVINSLPTWRQWIYDIFGK